MKPVCVKCQRFFRPKKNGIAFIEGKPKPKLGRLDEIPRGIEGAGLWDSYKLWVGDLWECRGCRTEIIVGVGVRPIAEHYQPDFKKTCTIYDAQLLVKDC